MKENKKKWLHLDGPVDYNWVENLNSALDETAKMSLPSGEQIVMSQDMAILLETNSMRNMTPATVSRCGLVCLDPQQSCDTKAIFNTWLRDLTPNLKEYAPEIENAVNWLIVEGIAVFEEEKKAHKVLLPAIDLHWIIQNFQRMLTAMVFDYFLEYEQNNEVFMNTQAQRKYQDLEQALHINVKNTWVEEVDIDAEFTEYATEQLVGESRPTIGSRHGQVGGARALRVETPDVADRVDKTRRLPRCYFMDDELRYENALKFAPIWVECFVLFSLVWSFNPVLTENGRKEFDRRLRKKYEMCRSDYGTYQREKKKKEKAGKSKQKKGLTKEATVAEIKNRMILRAQDGLTLSWTDDMLERPLLISNYPQDASFFDYYFDLDRNDWAAFDVKQEIEGATSVYHGLIPSQKRIENLYVPTDENMRYNFILECLLTRQISALVLGPATSGRSALMRNLLFDAVYEFSKKLMSEHITLSKHSTCVSFKTMVEPLLEYKQEKNRRCRRLRPPAGNKLFCYIQDLHLSGVDQFGDQSAVEVIRDFLNVSSWLSLRKIRIRQIADVTFIADMAINSASTANVSERVLHRMNLVVLSALNLGSFKVQIQTLADMVMSSWFQLDRNIKEYAQRTIRSLSEICEVALHRLKPTPSKAHYTFNWKDITKILLSIQTVESNSMKSQKDVMSLMYHECLRTFGDRLLMQHDRHFFLDQLEEVCRKHFDVVDQSSEEYQVLVKQKATPSSIARYFAAKDKFVFDFGKPEAILFSQWNSEIEGRYLQVQNDPEEIGHVVQGCLDRYNDSNERVNIDLLLYTQLNLHMVKILRVISASAGHLINVAMKGFGQKAAVKLVAFAAGHTLVSIEAYQGYSEADWQSDLRQMLVDTAISDRPHTLHVDEFALLEDQWYTDLECLLKNNVQSETIRKSDILKIITAIHAEVEKEKLGTRLGLPAEEIKKEKLADYEAKKHQEEQQPHVVALEQQRMQKTLLKNPALEAEMYKVYLNRIKTNFHLVLQYSPSGANFRQKLNKHQEIMYLTQMIFWKDLRPADLTSLGAAFLDKRVQDELDALLVRRGQVPESAGQRLRKEREEDSKILRCVARMYLYSQYMTERYANDAHQHYQLTPSHYLLTFQYQRHLIESKREDMKEHIEKYNAGLRKLKETLQAIYNYHTQLKKKGPELQSRLEHIERLVIEIEEEFMRVKGKREDLKRAAFEVSEKTGQSKEIQLACEETMNRIVPSLNQAINSVDAIQKADLAQLRSMNKPPKSIKIALTILCIFLEIPPADKLSKKTGQPKKSYWKAAQSKDVLGNIELPRIMIDFDRNKITKETMLQVEAEMLHPDFSYQKAHTASRAATGIFKWIKFTRDYFYVFKEIEPRRDAHMAA
jgi:dynein heavy chain